jgi:Domain of unknown function (DUF4381)
MSARLERHATPVCAAAAVGLIVALSAAGPSPAAQEPLSATASPAAHAPLNTLASPAAQEPLAATASPGAPAPPGTTAAAPAADLSPADDIRDIRGPKHIFPFWQVVALLAGAALLAIGVYALWAWRRRPRLRKLELYEITLQQLEEIRALMQPSSVREFSIAISDIVRRYIEDGFQITATHRTTEEFLHDLLGTSNEALAAHRNLLAEFLGRCDEAKFAGAGLSMPIMESLHRSARIFVIESSRPAAPGKAPETPPATLHAGGA